MLKLSGVNKSTIGMQICGQQIYLQENPDLDIKILVVRECEDDIQM